MECMHLHNAIQSLTDPHKVDEFLYQNNGHSIAMDVGGKGIGGIVPTFLRNFAA